jgi:hypothetical protein
MQTMSDQTACALEKLQVFIVEGIQFIALGIEHPENVPVIISHRDNNLGPSCMKRRQITNIFAYVAHDDGLPRLERSAAQALTSRESWVRRRFLAGFRQNYEFILDDFVNADPAVIPRGANHFHDLLHSFAGTPAGQRECADLLELLARGFFHSWGSNLAHLETER